MAGSQHICSVADCDKKKYARGWCKTHYTRWLRNGDLLISKTPSGEPLRWVRALAKNPPDTCVEWPFAKKGNGYGAVRFEGMDMGAHRLALILKTGENPSDMEAAHGPCRNRACVNPRHLSWKTRKENERDKVRDGCASVKLSAAIAAEIRNDLEPARLLAERYGVSASTIRRVKQGVIWA
jgi:hypothetical protein